MNLTPTCWISVAVALIVIAVLLPLMLRCFKSLATMLAPPPTRESESSFMRAQRDRDAKWGDR